MLTVESRLHAFSRRTAAVPSWSPSVAIGADHWFGTATPRLWAQAREMQRCILLIQHRCVVVVYMHPGPLLLSEPVVAPCAKMEQVLLGGRRMRRSQMRESAFGCNIKNSAGWLS